MWTSVHRRKKWNKSRGTAPNDANGAKSIRIAFASTSLASQKAWKEIFFHMMCVTGTKTGLKQFVNLTWSHFLSSLIICIGPSCWLHHCWTYLSPGGTQPYITIIPVELCRGWAVGRSVFCLVTCFLAFLNRRRSCAIGSKNSAEDVAGSLIERNRWMCWLKVSHQYSIIRQKSWEFGRFLLIIGFFFKTSGRRLERILGFQLERGGSLIGTRNAVHLRHKLSKKRIEFI